MIERRETLKLFDVRSHDRGQRKAILDIMMETGRKAAGQGCGICYRACGWRCHRDLKDCCRLLTIKRGAIFAGRAQVSGAIKRGIAAVRSGAACIVRDSEVDGETAKYTNSPATVGGKGVWHSMQSGAVGGGSFCSSATWRVPQLGFWHWIKVLRTVVLPRSSAHALRRGLSLLCQPVWGACGFSDKDKTVVCASIESGNGLG